MSTTTEKRSTGSVTEPTESSSSARAQKKKTSVALTLGSGGARGYAHIGAIEVLTERGYDITA
ncbi:MAG: alpha/beta hydrolase, partial [Gammaproteobacteria bacterium]